MSKLLNDLEELERDEKVDLFRLSLHIQSTEDLDVFDPVQKKEVLKIFDELMRDTKKHVRLITRIKTILEKYKSKEQGGS